MTNFPGNLEAIRPSDAAKIKFASERRVEQAVRDGVLESEGDEVVWNEAFESWMPRVEEEDLCYRVSMARTYTTTIRIGVERERLVKETARTAKSQAAGWDIVPVREENMSLLLQQQRGSIDGNVCTEYMVNDVRRALRLGRPVYQKRVFTGIQAYSQKFHPCPPLLPGHSIAKSQGQQSALGVAIEEGVVDAIRYYDAVLVVNNDALRDWRGQDKHHNLFSKGLLRA